MLISVADGVKLRKVGAVLRVTAQCLEFACTYKGGGVKRLISSTLALARIHRCSPGLALADLHLPVVQTVVS